uniref:Uncharacterized protein n=1 Tax=Arion vulgaris TaxID=1028688 RepID=A0A0B7AK96_9EUPU
MQRAREEYPRTTNVSIFQQLKIEDKLLIKKIEMKYFGNIKQHDSRKDHSRGHDTKQTKERKTKEKMGVGHR